MKFVQPIWLLVGLIACAALLWRYRRFDARQRRELAEFIAPNLAAQLTASVSPARRIFKRALVVAGVACVALALARPLFGFHWEETKRKGLDLLIAVDTSKSMLAQDVKPDRLTRAKMAVEDLIAKMDGDRVGLIAFAGKAFLQCPLTLDQDAFRQSLAALDTSIIPRGGTDLAAAIHEAEAALENNGNNERILVILTDGEDLEGRALDAAKAAAQNGMKIFTVGVGSASGELVPVEDGQGGTQFVKDASGQFVKSRLDETMLRQIAEATGAMYQPLGQQALGLETIYTEGLAPFTRREVASRMHKVYLERFQWPLGLGLLCLALESLLGIRKRRTARQHSANPRPALAAAWNKMARPARTLATVATAVALLVCADSARASAGSAEKAFQQGNFEKAEQEYQKAAEKHPDKPVLQYNHGAAAYKAGQFEPAAESFAKVTGAPDPKLQQDNFYNLGNTQYRLGQQTEQSNPQDTIKTWEQAVASYESALQLQPEDADAQFNRDFVKRKIEELKKQQQQEQQQNQDQQQNQNQQNQDQAKQDQQQDQQDRQNQDSSQQANQDQKQENDQQSGKDQDQQQQDKQQQAGQQPQPDKGDPKQEQQNQQAKADQKPEQDKRDGQPQPHNPQPTKDKPEQQADFRPEPGKMSREEAKQLLDSLKDGDRQMPLTPATRGEQTARSDEPLKDW